MISLVRARIVIPLYGRMDLSEEDFTIDRCIFRQRHLILRDPSLSESNFEEI